MERYILVCYDKLTNGKMIHDIIYQNDNLDYVKNIYYHSIDFQNKRGYDLKIFEVK